jgi:putative DNA primase/helicase
MEHFSNEGDQFRRPQLTADSDIAQGGTAAPLAVDPEGACENDSTPVAVDFVTILTAKGYRLTKQIWVSADQKGWWSEDYDRPTHFDFARKAVKGLDDIKRVLDEIGQDSCPILGRLKDGVDPKGTLRRLLDRKCDDGTLEPATIEDTPHFWLPIDVDSLEARDDRGKFWSLGNPERAVHCVLQRLPSEFQAADCVWQFTSHAGFKPGIRMRLYFWLTRPLTGAEMEIWLGECDIVDPSIFMPAQPIYAAPPVIEGLRDPVPQRTGILYQSGPVTPPESIPTKFKKKAKLPSGSTVKKLDAGVDGGGHERGVDPRSRPGQGPETPDYDDPETITWAIELIHGDLAAHGLPEIGKRSDNRTFALVGKLRDGPAWGKSLEPETMADLLKKHWAPHFDLEWLLKKANGNHRNDPGVGPAGAGRLFGAEADEFSSGPLDVVLGDPLAGSVSPAEMNTGCPKDELSAMELPGLQIGDENSRGRKAKPGFVADTPEVIDDVIEYLLREAPVFNGGDGDPATILVANRCGDLGATAKMACGLMLEHWSCRCVPPWNRDELGYKVASAYRSRRDEIGCDAGKPVLLSPSTPYLTAKRFLRRCYTDVEGRKTLIRYRSDFYEWTGTHYRELPDEELRGLLYEFLNKAVTPGKDSTIKPFNPDRNDVGKVMDALPGLIFVQSHIEAPAWLHPRGGVGAALGASAGEFIPCRNGLLHSSGALLDHEANMLNFNVLGFDYDPNAPDPVEWLKFLASLWPNDREAIDTLQEIFGYCVSGRTDLQKIFLLLGPTRCGKGTILFMLKELLGHENVTSPTLTSLKGEFGLQPLVGKTAAMISDARMDFGGSQAIVVERLLTISGEDSLSVNRKNKTAWEGKLGARFIIASNEALRLNDASGAIASRMVPLRIRVSFYGKEDLGLKERLKPELPGIFKWALQGLRRLISRGHFVLPASSRSTMDEMEALASPILTFVAECCIVGPDQRVETDPLYSAWTMWCARTGLPAGSTAEFGRKLAAAVPTLERKRFGNGREGGDRPWGYQGIGLRNGTGTFDEALAAE